jgi:hypothetical protein
LRDGVSGEPVPATIFAIANAGAAPTQCREPNILSGVLSGVNQDKPMNARNELYFRQAEHCRKMADTSKIEQTKAEWLLLAERWLRMIREDVSNVVQGHFEERKPA